MFDALRERVLLANQQLPVHGLVIYTWGNVSAADWNLGVFAIKPSGIPYAQLEKEDIVVLDLEGNVVAGDKRPSSDMPTHLVMYQNMKQVGSIVHTHSPWATSWAQAGMPIPPLGTTHADYFYGAIPCTRELTLEEITQNYEAETGKVIIETLTGANPMEVPGILVNGHASFCWGKDEDDAVHNAVVLEEIAKMAFTTRLLNPSVQNLPQHVLDKHYLRKHGTHAYYGQ